MASMVKSVLQILIIDDSDCKHEAAGNERIHSPN